MKFGHLILLLIFSISLSNLKAQVPEAIKYQAVVRNAEGEILQNQAVSFEINILAGSPSSGTIIYTETHVDTTNEHGISNLHIGEGNVLSGNFSSIDWSANSHFIRIALDPTGGDSYQVMGSSEIVSVPYAIQAKESAYLDGHQPIDFAGTDHTHTPLASAFGRINRYDVNTTYCYNVEEVVWNADLERYEITINNQYFSQNDAAVVTISGDAGSCPAGAVARQSSVSGKLLVYILNNAGDKIECSFRFVVFNQ